MPGQWVVPAGWFSKFVLEFNSRSIADPNLSPKNLESKKGIVFSQCNLTLVPVQRKIGDNKGIRAIWFLPVVHNPHERAQGPVN